MPSRPPIRRPSFPVAMAHPTPLDSQSGSGDDVFHPQSGGVFPPYLSNQRSPVRRDPNGRSTPDRISQRRSSMQYALLIYGQEPTAAVPEDQMTAQFAAYETFTTFLRDGGALKAGVDVQPTATP